MNATLSQFARGLGDVVFPPGCVMCRGMVGNTGDETAGFRHVCDRCAKQIHYVARAYQSGDLTGAFMVICATDQTEINHQVWQEATATPMAASAR